MKTMFILVCIVSMILSFIFVESGMAKIDPQFIVGVWTLDDDNGLTTKDSSANGRDGTIQGAKWEAGQKGSALSFEKGNTVVVTLGKGVVRDQLTVILWLKFLDLTGQQNYFSIWDSSDHRYVPYKTDGHELRFWTNNWNIGSTFIVKKDVWYHVANVYDGKTASIYVDGELKISQPGTFTLDDNQQSSWFATDKGGWLSACMEDEIGIFTTALSQDEVKSIKDHGIIWALGGAAVGRLDTISTTWGTIKTRR